MYRVVVLLGVFITGTLATNDDNLKKCVEAFNRDKVHCCITMTSDPEFTTNPKIKECFDLKDSPTSCDVDICAAKKLGYYGADGGLDLKALIGVLENKFKEKRDQSLYVTVKEKCLSGNDMSKYGNADMCEFKKMKHCLHIAFLKYCPEWSDEGDCSGMKKSVEECTVNY